MDQESIDKANKLYDEGLISELHEFIKPYLKVNDPYALYLYAGFSLLGESDEEYDKRYMDLMTKAAEANVPAAMHQLAALYFVGDGVPMDTEVGRRYLDGAMKLGYGIAKYSVAMNLYYGSNGYSKDIDKAIEIMSEAVKDNVEGAPEALEKFKE